MPARRSGCAASVVPYGAGVLLTAPMLTDRHGVFADRAGAGRALAGLLHRLEGTDALVLAIPAGGVPVGAALAEALGLALEVAPVSARGTT